MYYSKCRSLIQSRTCFVKRPFYSFLLFSGACLRALLYAVMDSLKSKCKALFRSRGCFGCFSKPSKISYVGEPSKVPRAKGRMVRRSSTSDNLWSTTEGEMDDSAVQSPKGTLNQPPDLCSTSNSSQFVNHGLLLWTQTRQQWLGNKRMDNRPQLREPTIRWNTSYESLLGTDKPFARPIPLAEMVDFLVDVWKQEGLLD